MASASASASASLPAHLAAHHRGFSILHQRLLLRFPPSILAHPLAAHAELSILPLRPDLATVYLHAGPLLHIRAVFLLPSAPPADRPSSVCPSPQEPLPLTFSLCHPAPVQVPEPPSVRQFPEAKRRLFEAVNARDSGELAISLPSLLLRTRPSQTEFEPITLRIDYTLHPSSAAVDHALGFSSSPSSPPPTPHWPHLFATSGSPRRWMPCLDSLRERHPWEIGLIVPRTISPGPGLPDHPVVALASGECLEHFVHPVHPALAVFSYALPIPTSAQHLAWLVGPFDLLDLSPQPSLFDPVQEHPHLAPDNNDSSSDPLRLRAFCLPGRKAELHNAVQFLPHAAAFFSREFGSYPFSSYTVVFVDADAASHIALAPLANSASLTIYPSDLLYPADVLDQVYESKPVFVHALASQWVGINIVPRQPSDSWLVNGLALYTSGLYLRFIWGTNEYRYRIKKDMLRCVELDVDKPPICQPGLPDALDSELLGFVNLKASLVLFILDRYLRRSGGGNSLGLSRVIPKVFLSAISGELKDNFLATSSFLRICRKISGTELKGWADQWIYSSGCPIFEVTAHFNRKKMTHELNLRQMNSCASYYHQDDPGLSTTWEEKANLKPLDRFEGQMTIRIHESDGVPYEHVLDIKDPFRRYELPSNHRNHRRAKRSSKRYLTLNRSLSNCEDQDGDQLIGAVVFRDETDRQHWRITDWSEEEDLMMCQSGVEWIRLDVEMEWICEFRLEMSSFMWLEQLQRERDVVAQLEATQALKRLPSKVISSYLCRTVLTAEYFLKIRIEAILALVSCADHQHEFIGLFHLFKLYQHFFCYPPQQNSQDPLKMRMIPKPNHFDDFVAYFLRKALVVAISQVRDRNKSSPAICQQFFLDQLVYNNNSFNQYSDAHFLSTLVAAMSDLFIHSSHPDKIDGLSQLYAAPPDDRGVLSTQPSSGHSKSDEPEGNRISTLINELDRCLMVDRLVPSYRNLVTLAAIEAKLKLTLAGLIPVDFLFFLTCTREGNYPPIRVLAFDCLLLLRGFQEKAIVRYMFLVMKEDQSLLVKRRLAMGLVQCLPILVLMEEFEMESSKGGLSVIEGTALHSKHKIKLDHKSVSKQLRVEVGRALILRECILSVMLHPLVDIDVQTCLLKLSEVLFKPLDETPPVVHVPASIPVVPEPPALPPTLAKIRIPVSVANVEGDIQALSPLPKIILPAQHLASGEPKDQNALPALIDLVQAEVPPQLVATLIKKPKPAPKPKKFQASGMSIPDHKMCQSLLKKLISHPLGAPFRRPVDPIRQGAPDYFNIISRPMDFKTMGDKLEMGHYPNRDAFRDDFNLVLENCTTYNLAESVLVMKHVEPMRAIFDRLWERSEKTMNALQAKGIGGANAGWMSSEVKPLLPPPNNLPIAPPPSFADFAAGGSKIPPPPTTPSPLPLPSWPSRAGPEATKAVGLKVKLKPRSSISLTGPATNMTLGDDGSSMPPPTSKPSLKIKFASGTPGPTSVSTPKSAALAGPTKVTTAHPGPNFPAPPPPSFALPSTPGASVPLIKSKVQPPPTFPAPPPPTLESLTLTVVTATSQPQLPLPLQGVPDSSAPAEATDSEASLARIGADENRRSPSSSLPLVGNTSQLLASATDRPTQTSPIIIAKPIKPPPKPPLPSTRCAGFSTSDPPGTNPLPPSPYSSFPAPPPPAIPEFDPVSCSLPASFTTGHAPPPYKTAPPPPSNLTKIKVVNHPPRPPANQERTTLAEASRALLPPSPMDMPVQGTAVHKPGKVAGRVTQVAAASVQESNERSWPNSVDQAIAVSESAVPMAVATTPTPNKKSKVKKTPTSREPVSSNRKANSLVVLQAPSALSPPRSTSSSTSVLPAASERGGTVAPPASLIASPDTSTTLAGANRLGESLVLSTAPLKVTDEPLNPRKARTIIRKMMDLPSGLWFRAPVNPVEVGAPTYYDEIKYPMDLSTMLKKVDQGGYKRQSDVMDDFALIVSNCIQFNGEGVQVSLDARLLEKAWKVEWEKASKLSYTDKRSLLGLFNKLNQVPGVDVFSEPVDPVLLQIPTYFTVIGGRENARDLGTIKRKLNADGYNSVNEFEADVRQMFRNCFVFNPPETPVAQIGKDLERAFDAGISKIKKDSSNAPNSASGNQLIRGGTCGGSPAGSSGTGQGPSSGPEGQNNIVGGNSSQKRKAGESGSNLKRTKIV